MAYNPNIPAPTNRVQDDIAAMRGNFQHLAPLAQAVDELQTVSGLAPVANELQTVSGLAPHVQALLDSRIVEMGSNANGEYVRWENGVQICFVRGVAFTGDGTSDVKTGSWTHPAAFASPPAIVGRNSNPEATPIWHVEVNPGLDTGITIVFWRAYRQSGSWPSGVNYPLHYIAIGRWK